MSMGTFGVRIWTLIRVWDRVRDRVRVRFRFRVAYMRTRNTIAVGLRIQLVLGERLQSQLSYAHAQDRGIHRVFIGYS